MSLRRLAGLTLSATLALGALVLAVGLVVWQQARSNLAEAETLMAARDSAYRIDVAIRYLNHVRVDPGILRGLVQQSERLTLLLEGERHAEAETARLHLGEIAEVARTALAEIERGKDVDATRRNLAPMTSQLRIHESRALDALNEIIEDRNRGIATTLMRAILLLILIAAAVAAVSCAGFWLFFRRIRDPLRSVSDAVRRFGAGDDSVRVPVKSQDEIGDMATLFNQAMEQRAAYQLQLQERIKEQQCLYRVLELTTDDNRPVVEICRETAAVIPPHMLHEDAAIARVQWAGESFASGHWDDAGASLVSPILVDGAEHGRVEVAYVGERPEQAGGEGPFLAEEHVMLDAIAMHLARMLRDRKLRAELARSQRLQAVGELTGGVAHDFNNLLTVIMGNAELLSDMHRESDPRSADLAAVIQTASSRGAALTQRLLAFARRQPLEPRTTDVNQLVEETRGLLERTLGEHVQLDFRLTEGLWSACIDPSQLEAALLNLVVNARDAMPAGGGVMIETANATFDANYTAARPDVSPGDYVMVAVSDTGTGIPPEVLERVFEPFFTTKEKGRGTGLGLSMVYGFTKQSSGHIAIYSEPEAGTTIRLYLPRAGDDEAPQEKTEAAAVPTGDAHVLVVEDDELVRAYTRDQLLSLGYHVRSASHASEALQILDNDDSIDLLLTDVVIPGGMDGRDLARKALARRPALKVLYMSGYTENAIVHHGRLDPDVSLLSKPFRRADLADKLHAVLAG